MTLTRNSLASLHLEVTNLGRMRKGLPSFVNIVSIFTSFLDFPRTRQIFLEENYRSTGSILTACLAIVSQGIVQSCITLRMPTLTEILR